MAPGYSILQIGFDKCRGGACGPTSPQNQLYYFWAYGRNPQGACGAGIAPVPVAIAGTPSGTPRFKIERAGADRAYHYEVLIDNVLKGYVFIGDVESCWTGGSARSSFFNEVLDLGTQSGGTSVDKQDFRDVRYKTDAWYLLTRGLGDDCDIIDRTTQRCITSTTDNNNYYTWDTRY